MEFARRYRLAKRDGRGDRREAASGRIANSASINPRSGFDPEARQGPFENPYVDPEKALSIVGNSTHVPSLSRASPQN
ncbi:hypothetical protein IE4872_PC00128 (plasmid) [Rhizobium gallicum]|uniref:Uncharacterized protein n=1 Tax=Rhizobium gallicum TaxID=56730 RepID=A0A1L5NQP7_9HYPH|nr:hypothetical protein IE4872_PC00128 [Rhizobium gallicum]